MAHTVRSSAGHLNTGKGVLNGHGSAPARAYAGGHGCCKQRKNSPACAAQADERSGATYAAPLLFIAYLVTLNTIFL